MFKILKIAFIQILIFVFLGELITQIFYPIPPASSPPKTIHYGTVALDKEYGWFPKAHFSFQDSILDSSGEEYEVKYESAKNGFRFFGNLQQDSIPKVLFIGDSFTQSAEVSNDKTFYNLISDSLDIDIFAFGSFGYGTYQAYLVFEKYYDLIKPDLVFWQFCTNDFIDNHYELESACLYNNGKERPYLRNGTTVFKNPKKNNHILLKKSALAYNLNMLYEHIIDAEPGETSIAKEGLQYKLFQEASNVTDAILKKIKAKIGNEAKLAMFCADHYEPQFSNFAQLLKNNEITFIPDNIHRLNEAKSQQKIVFCYDNVHWNETGHAVVANALLAAIKREGLLEGE